MTDSPTQPIDPGVGIGHFHLRISDADTMLAFYCDVLGFDVVCDFRDVYNPNWGTNGDAVFLSAGGYHHHIGANTWNSAGGLPQAEPGAGIHELGFVLPTRAALGAVTQRLLDADARIIGGSVTHHGETVHVDDPDGIRLAFSWEGTGAERGTELNLEELAAAVEPAQRSAVQGFVPSVREAPAPIDPRTRAGYAHLRTADLDAIRRYYVDVLGWQPLEDRGGLLRLSADGRTEVLAFNDWHSAGHPRTEDGRTGLHHIAIRYPSKQSLYDATARLRRAGYPEPPAATQSPMHLAAYFEDPDGNTIELHHDEPREQWRDPYSGAPNGTKVTIDEMVALASIDA